MVNIKRDKKYSPDFIGIGAMRCGTTWIAEKLRKHPDIYIIALGDKAIRYSLKIANILRNNDTGGYRYI